MSGFEPVHLPPERALNRRVSQTMLRHFNACPRSGYLYALYRGEARTVEMVRGTAIHAVLERAVRTLVDMGEAVMPPDVMKTLVAEVLAEQQVPVEEHDYIREACHRWASTTGVDASQVIAVETLIVLRVGGWDVRMKVDFGELLEDGAALLLRDYKSARAMPQQEEIARRRPDGTLAAKSFQLVLYALGMAFGVPVRIEPCVCQRDDVVLSAGGVPMTAADPGGQARLDAVRAADGRTQDACAVCRGRGYVEVQEPFPLASRVQRFDLEYVFPGIDIGGEMGRRGMSLTRLELEEYRASLEAVVANVERAEESGDWPAIVSDAACGECPASSLCPIPRELRDHRGTINSVEEAAEAAMVLEREQAEHRARRAEIKAFVKAHGGELVFGRRVFEFVPTSSERVNKREEMFAAMERAVSYGEPFDRGAFVKTVNGTDFKARDLTVDELARLEGSNEGVQDDGGRDDAGG